MNIVKDKIWESLTITNDFIFAKVMENEGICKKVLEVLLNMEVGHVAYVENEKTIAFGLSSKGVRLDVFVKDEDTLYNIEMQVTNNKDLGKRSRYYQACIDLHSLEKGVTYKQMKKSYIVFICAFDPFQENMAKYEFRSYCIDNKDIELEDGAVRIFFNAKAYRKEEDEDRRAFLKYVNGEKTNNKFVEELEEIVKGIKDNREWRKEYMNLYMRELELKEESYEKGMKVGVQTGMRKGIEQGLKKGVQQGLKQGVQQGLKQGVEEGIRNTILILKGMHLPMEEIINKVSKQFNISKKEVEKYL